MDIYDPLRDWAAYESVDKICSVTFESAKENNHARNRNRNN